MPERAVSVRYMRCVCRATGMLSSRRTVDCKSAQPSSTLGRASIGETQESANFGRGAGGDF